MDWNRVHRDSPQKATGDLAVVETCWRMRSRRTHARVLTCGIYRSTAGLVEVRCGYEPDDLLRSQVASDIAAAREIADDWRQAVIAKGGFEELRGGV